MAAVTRRHNLLALARLRGTVQAAPPWCGRLDRVGLRASDALVLDSVSSPFPRGRVQAPLDAGLPA